MVRRVSQCPWDWGLGGVIRAGGAEMRPHLPRQVPNWCGLSRRTSEITHFREVTTLDIFIMCCYGYGHFNCPKVSRRVLGHDLALSRGRKGSASQSRSEGTLEPKIKLPHYYIHELCLFNVVAVVMRTFPPGQRVYSCI